MTDGPKKLSPPRNWKSEFDRCVGIIGRFVYRLNSCFFNTSSQELRLGSLNDKCTLVKFSADGEVQITPLLSGQCSRGKEDLFIERLKHCSFSHDVETTPEPLTDIQWRNVKCENLKDMIKYVNNCQNALTKRTNQHVINVFVANIFNSPKAKAKFELLLPLFELVCELFLTCLDSKEFQSNKYIDEAFVRALLKNIASKHEQERKAMRLILTRIYALMLPLKASIRKEIGNTLCSVMEDSKDHSGIAEILELTAEIVCGFVLPIKDQHKHLLLKVLMPLHKLESLTYFRKELIQCLHIYLFKDPSLYCPVMRSLLKCWPNANTQKEQMFLNELSCLLEFIKPAEFKNVMVPLFRQMAKCVSGPHSRVAKKALLIWINPNVISLILINRQVLFPIIIPALNRAQIWEKAVQDLIVEVRNTIKLKCYEYLQEENRQDKNFNR